MDGTLADSFPWFARNLDSVADKFGFRRVSQQEADTLRRMDSARILQWLGVPLWKVPLIARHMRALKRKHLDEIPLFPGVERMLRDLKARGMRLAIVSSDNEANIRRALGPDTAALIDAYGCGASLFGKAAKFRQVLKRTGIAAANSITIGDELRDAEAARAAGIAFGAVAWGYTHADALAAAKPALMFETLDEIPARLGG